MTGQHRPERVIAGARPSPNIWGSPSTYEVFSHAVDPDGLIDAELRSIADWSGRTLLDVGCGTGFHLPLFAATAQRVVGVEPHADLLALAARRTRRLPHVELRQATAQALPLPDASVDITHARWAYFFGPGCEPGLAELSRVVRRGGTSFVIDNDPTRTTFGRWFARAFPMINPDEVEGFWSRQGWTTRPLTVRWVFGSRADAESVVHREFPPEVAEAAMQEWPAAEGDGLEIDYGVLVRWRHY